MYRGTLEGSEASYAPRSTRTPRKRPAGWGPTQANSFYLFIYLYELLHNNVYPYLQALMWLLTRIKAPQMINYNLLDGTLTFQDEQDLNEATGNLQAQLHTSSTSCTAI